VAACSSCGKENPGEARFCLACGSPLAAEAPPSDAAVCGSCGTANPGGARFCVACGTPLAAATPPPPAPAEERKVITALFTDIVGSTASAEQLDVEDVGARLRPYYARVRRELESFGGTVEKFIGDAVVAIFGAPVAHEDDPERAVRAALAVSDAIADLNRHDAWLDLHVRTAVNTGEALIQLGARTSEGEGMATGDVMNTAARLQSAAPVDGVVVSETTYRATEHLFEYREGEPVQAKGKSQPLRAWVATAVREASAHGVPATPLVGREKECRRLRDVWRDAVEGRRTVAATVLGPPGIGKTRLLDEVAECAAGADVHRGRCLAYGEGITYWPLVEIVRSAAGIRVDDDGDANSAKLGALLDGLPTEDADELRTMAAALANLIGVPTTPRGTYSAADIGQHELHWGIRRVLQLLATIQPLLLVLEDLHWAEETLLDFLRYVVEGEAEAPILVLASTRPELRESRPALLAETERRHVVELGALGEDESRALLADLLPDAVGARALESLLLNAGGNPLFLEETVRMLTDTGALAEGADLETLPVPGNLHALISSRLDQLPRFEKQVAQNASVLGSVFWSGALAQLDGLVGDLDHGLALLEQRDFVHAHEVSSVAGEREYSFRHALIRDVAYGQLPKGRRATLHVRFADWLEDVPGPEDEYVEILAYHLEQSCRLAREVARSPVEPPVLRAVEALMHSGQKAERREGIREADRFYARGLELVDGDHGEKRLELQLRRCYTLIALGRLAEAWEQLAGVAEEALGLKRADLRCQALLGLANVDRKQGRAEESRRRLAEAEALALEIGDRGLEVRAVYELSTLRAWIDGSSETALGDLHRARGLADELGDRPLQIEGDMRLASLLFNRGKLVATEEHLVRACELASEVGSVRDEARARSLLAYARLYLEEIDETERLALEALDQLERTCDTHLQLQNLRVLAKCALARAEPTLAEQRLRDAIPLALEAGGWLVIEIYRYLVDALVQQSRLDEARELLTFAARNVPEGDLYARGALCLGEALLATARSEREPALRAFEESLDLLERANQVTDLAEARIQFARALRRFGEGTRAESELERARETFAAMEARTPLAEIERELEALRRGAGAAAGPSVSG